MVCNAVQPGKDSTSSTRHGYCLDSARFRPYRADSYGPRPIIWLPVALQCFEALTTLLLYAFGTSRAVSLITMICVAAMLFWLALNWQTAAITRSDRLPMGRFALVAAVITIAGVAAGRIIH